MLNPFAKFNFTGNGSSVLADNPFEKFDFSQQLSDTYPSIDPVRTPLQGTTAIMPLSEVTIAPDPEPPLTEPEITARNRARIMAEQPWRDPNYPFTNITGIEVDPRKEELKKLREKGTAGWVDVAALAGKEIGTAALKTAMGAMGALEILDVPRRLLTKGIYGHDFTWDETVNLMEEEFPDSPISPSVLAFAWMGAQDPFILTTLAKGGKEGTQALVKLAKTKGIPMTEEAIKKIRNVTSEVIETYKKSPLASEAGFAGIPKKPISGEPTLNSMIKQMGGLKVSPDIAGEIKELKNITGPGIFAEKGKGIDTFVAELKQEGILKGDEGWEKLQDILASGQGKYPVRWLRGNLTDAEFKLMNEGNSIEQIYNITIKGKPSIRPAKITKPKGMAEPVIGAERVIPTELAGGVLPSKELQPLMEEARKYKSVEEFVKAQRPAPIIDEFGKKIAGEKGGIKISIDSVDNPTYIALWDKGKQVGRLAVSKKAIGESG
ncbi:MAG: hypothetical protein QME51_03930, partial [Planctomycetota bacterium]|nr:hypothetical protein [Planctomycetota bacterium]